MKTSSSYTAWVTCFNDHNFTLRYGFTYQTLRVVLLATELSSDASCHSLNKFHLWEKLWWDGGTIIHCATIEWEGMTSSGGPPSPNEVSHHEIWFFLFLPQVLKMMWWLPIRRSHHVLPKFFSSLDHPRW